MFHGLVCVTYRKQGLNVVKFPSASSQPAGRPLWFGRTPYLNTSTISTSNKQFRPKINSFDRYRLFHQSCSLVLKSTHNSCPTSSHPLWSLVLKSDRTNRRPLVNWYYIFTCSETCQSAIIYMVWFQLRAVNSKQKSKRSVVNRLSICLCLIVVMSIHQGAKNKARQYSFPFGIRHAF